MAAVNWIFIQISQGISAKGTGCYNVPHSPHSDKPVCCEILNPNKNYNNTKQKQNNKRIAFAWKSIETLY